MKFAVVFIFAVFMACLEASVVVYLRELYYPDGFTIAFRLLDQHIIFTELLREFSTLIMIGTLALLCADSYNKRFAWFLYIFAIWDIFYYLWLKILINWPQSLFDWDILFLIPFTWLGPVFAPVLCSFAMLGLSILLFTTNAKVCFRHWMFLIMGSILILYTFLFDYGRILFRKPFISNLSNLLSNQDFIHQVQNMPTPVFLWNIFLVGLFIILIGLFFIWADTRRKHVTQLN